MGLLQTLGSVAGNLLGTLGNVVASLGSLLSGLL
jgi:hypothetical protein